MKLTSQEIKKANSLLKQFDEDTFDYSIIPDDFEQFLKDCEKSPDDNELMGVIMEGNLVSLLRNPSLNLLLSQACMIAKAVIYIRKQQRKSN